MFYLFIFILVTVFDTCINSLEAKKLKTVCYYTNWSQYRTGEGKFFPENIDENLCTHLIYAFAKLEGNRIIAQEWNDESTRWSKGMYERFNALKKKNSELRTLLAIGGWNAGSGPFSRMVATRQDRREFVQSTISYLRRWDFDGLDIDWEYPTKRGGVIQDKERFNLLLQELREAFQTESKNTGNRELLLTLAVPADKQKIDGGFHPPTIAKYADFVNVMTYDLHGAWDDVTGHNSPLYRGIHEPSGSLLNVDWVANYWKVKGVPNEKLIIGFPLYGRGFKLQDRGKTAPGSPTSGGSDKGSYTKEPGYLAYYEVCEVIQNGGTTKWIEDQKVPYIIYNGQWIGYDDARSFREKALWLKRKRYGGAMLWALPLDDFTGRFCNQGVKFPLLRSLVSELAIPYVDTPVVKNTSKTQINNGIIDTTGNDGSKYTTTVASKVTTTTAFTNDSIITTSNITLQTSGNETVNLNTTLRTVDENNSTLSILNTKDKNLQQNESKPDSNNAVINGSSSLENITSNVNQTDVYNETKTPYNLSNESYTELLNATTNGSKISTSNNISDEITSANTTSNISETSNRFPMRSLLQTRDSGQSSTRPRGSSGSSGSSRGSGGSGGGRGIGSVMNSLMTMISGFSQSIRGRSRNRGRNAGSQTTGSQQAVSDSANRNRGRNQVRPSGNQQTAASNVNRNRIRNQVRQTSRQQQRLSNSNRRNRIQDFPSPTTVPNVIATQPIDIPIDQQQDMVPVRIGPGGQISAQTGSSRNTVQRNTSGRRQNGRPITSVNNGVSLDSMRQVNRQRTTSLRQRNLVSPTATNNRQGLSTQQQLGQSRSQNQVNVNVQARSNMRNTNPTMMTRQNNIRQNSQNQPGRQNLVTGNSIQRSQVIQAPVGTISERQQSQILPSQQTSQQLPGQTPIQQQPQILQPLGNQWTQNVQLQNQMQTQRQTNVPQQLLNQPPIQRQQNTQQLLNQAPIPRPVNTPQQLLNQVPLQRPQNVQQLLNRVPLQRPQNVQQLQTNRIQTVQRPTITQASQNRLSVAGQIMNTEQRRLLASGSNPVGQPNGAQQIELQIGVGNQNRVPSDMSSLLTNQNQAPSGISNRLTNQLPANVLMANSIRQQVNPTGRSSSPVNSPASMMNSNLQSLMTGLGSGAPSTQNLLTSQLPNSVLKQLQGQGLNQNIDPATLQMLLQQTSSNTELPSTTSSKPGDMNALMLQALMTSNSKGNTQLLGNSNQQIPGLLNLGSSSQSVSPMQVLLMQRLLQGGNGEQSGNAVEQSDAQENKLEQRADQMKNRNQNMNPLLLQLLTQQMNSNTVTTTAGPMLGQPQALPKSQTNNKSQNMNSLLLQEQSMNPLMMQLLAQQMSGNSGSGLLNQMFNTAQGQNESQNLNSILTPPEQNINPAMLQLLGQQRNGNTRSSIPNPNSILTPPEQNINPAMLQLLGQQRNGNIRSSIPTPVNSNSGSITTMPTRGQPQDQNTLLNKNRLMLEEMRKQMGIKATEVMNIPTATPVTNAIPGTAVVKKVDMTGSPAVQSSVSTGSNRQTEVKSALEQLQRRGLLQNIDVPLLLALNEQLSRNNSANNNPIIPKAQVQEPAKVEIVGLASERRNTIVNSATAPGASGQRNTITNSDSSPRQTGPRNSRPNVASTLRATEQRNNMKNAASKQRSMMTNSATPLTVAEPRNNKISSERHSNQGNGVIQSGTLSSQMNGNLATRVEMTQRKAVINERIPPVTEQRNAVTTFDKMNNDIINSATSQAIKENNNLEISGKLSKSSNSDKALLQTPEDIIASRLEQNILNRLLKNSRLASLSNNGPLSSTNVEPKFQWLERKNPSPSMTLEQTKTILQNSKPLPNLSETIGFSFLESTPPEVSKMTRDTDITALRDRVMTKIQDNNANSPTIISANSANLSPLLGNRNVSLLVIPLDGLDRHIYNILNQSRNKPQVNPVNPAPVINLVVQSGPPASNNEVVKIQEQRIPTKRPALQTIDIVTLGPSAADPLPTRPPIPRPPVTRRPVPRRPPVVKSIKAIQSPTQIFSKSDGRLNRPKPPPIKQSQIADNTTVILNSVVPKTRTNNNTKTSNSEVLWKWQV